MHLSNSPRQSSGGGITGTPAIAAPVPAISRQSTLFPRHAVVELPRREQSADSLGEAQADDQHWYYIKGDAHGRPVRASEWICTHIAEDVHIGAPTCALIRLQSGLVVFGSRRIAQVSDNIATARYLTTPTESNASGADNDLNKLLSSIYAFDMFVNNDDRHLGNYLTVEDRGVRRLYAFDFSRALFWHWPFQGFPAHDCNTLGGGRLLRSLHSFDEAAAMATLDMIEGLASSVLQGFISRMPADWLPPDVQTAFLEWWDNGGRTKRLDDLRKGIGDGTLL